jgi:DNA polymerase V
VRAARLCARAAWPKANSHQYGFTKAGVMLDDLLPIEKRPLTLFDTAKQKPNPAVEALDQINQRFGSKAMTLGSEGVERSWKMRSKYRSPRYTTRLSDLPVVR